MPARTRRERPQDRSRRLAEIRATGTRRRRLVERRAPDPGPRAVWAFALVALVLGVGAAMVIVFGDVAPRTAQRPTPAPSPVVTEAPPSPSPSSHLAVGGGGDGAVGDGRSAAPAATVAPRPTAQRTQRPFRTARPVATIPAPTAPTDGGAAAQALSVEFPREGETVVSSRINAFGHAPGGARVLRDLPDGSVETSVARPDGLWFQRIDLAPGDNALRFHLEGDDGTIVVHVLLQVR
ncbi:MAG: hypothetical protein U0869_05730 [Chloroflexota bacterium]